MYICGLVLRSVDSSSTPQCLRASAASILAPTLNSTAIVMSSSHQQTPTTTPTGSVSETEVDPAFALTELLMKEVGPLLISIRKKYREIADDDSTVGHRSEINEGPHADSLNDKLVPTYEQGEAFAALNTLFSVGSYATGSSGGSQDIWKDVLAKDAEADLVSVTGHPSRLHLQMTSGQESGLSPEADAQEKSTLSVTGTGTEASAQTANPQPATGRSLASIVKLAPSIIARARIVLD